MIRKCVSVLVCTTLLAAATVRAESSMKSALSIVPADALAVVCVPSVKELDAHYERAINALQLQPFLPPPRNSIVALLKQNLPFAEGLDETGPFMVVVMPADNVFMLQTKMAVIVSTKEPRKVLEALGATAGEEGVWSLSLFGQPSFAVVSGQRLVVGASADVVKTIASSDKSLAAKLGAAQLEAMEGLAAVVHLDAGRLFGLAKPQIDGFLAMMAAAQAGGGGGALAARQADLSKKQLDTFINGLDTLAFGLLLDQTGLQLRFTMTTKADSKLRKMYAVRSTTEKLLRHLPAGNMMIAFGQTADPKQIDANLETVDDYFALADGVEGIDKEKFGKFKDLVKEWSRLATGVRGTIEIADSDEFGVLQAAAVFDVSDSTGWIDQFDKVVTLGKDILDDESMASLDPKIPQVANAIVWERDAEKIAGVPVSHFTLDLSKIEDVEEEDLDDLAEVIGKDGVMLRFAPANPKAVAVTFGGGSSFAGRVFELTRKNESPLDDLPGIKKTSAVLPQRRFGAAYIAVDKVLEGVGRIISAVGEESFPVRMHAIEAPLTFVESGSDGWLRLDILMPTELMVATKEAVMQTMGAGGAPPPGAPGGAKDPGSGDGGQ